MTETTSGVDPNELQAAVDAACKDGPGAVLAVLADPLEKMPDNREAAGILCWVLNDRVLPADQTAEIFQQILDAHPDDDWVLNALGASIEAARDIDDLNAPPPDIPLFASLAAKLAELHLKGCEVEEKRIASSLATTTRMMARQKDDISERAYARAVELDPDNDDAHYCQGLFFKTRGRFAEGMAANQRAFDLSGDSPSQAVQWNLGICATGAGEAEVALKVWKSLGNKLEIGRFGLPDGTYPTCKVRLAEHPLAERDKDTDHPGQEETIWIERLSPCHGIVRSVLYEDLGVDFGDVVLFDGAPITTHLYGERRVPVFPHLATLRRCGYRFFDFSATQPESNAVANASQHLANDAVIYSHTESMVVFCATCFRDEDVQHERHETEEHLVVHGRIAAPPDMTPAELLGQVDSALEHVPGARLFSPDLCFAAGEKDRAAIESRRFATLRG